MCGIVGIVGHTEVAAQLYDGLTVLQHRGQDAAGIATADGGKLRVHKGNGLVRDVFDERAMALLEGRVGIAHCRYPTAGSEAAMKRTFMSTRRSASPWPTMATDHTDALRGSVRTGSPQRQHRVDSEVLLNVFA